GRPAGVRVRRGDEDRAGRDAGLIVGLLADGLHGVAPDAADVQTHQCDALATVVEDHDAGVARIVDPGEVPLAVAGAFHAGVGRDVAFRKADAPPDGGRGGLVGWGDTV